MTNGIRMGIMELRQNLADRIDAAQHRGEPTVIYNARRGSKPVAVLVSYDFFAKANELLGLDGEPDENEDAAVEST